MDGIQEHRLRARFDGKPESGPHRVRGRVSIASHGTEPRLGLSPSTLLSSRLTILFSKTSLTHVTPRGVVSPVSRRYGYWGATDPPARLLADRGGEAGGELSAVVIEVPA